MDKSSLKSWYTGAQSFQAEGLAGNLGDRRDPFMAGALLPVRVLVSLHGFQAFITPDHKSGFPIHLYRAFCKDHSTFFSNRTNHAKTNASTARRLLD